LRIELRYDLQESKLDGNEDGRTHALSEMTAQEKLTGRKSGQQVNSAPIPSSSIKSRKIVPEA